MIETPFTEDDFYCDDRPFEELERMHYEVKMVGHWFVGDSMEEQPAFLVESEHGDTEWIALDEVSERDRPFVKKGSKMVEIHGRRKNQGERASFWVVKEWPK